MVDREEKLSRKGKSPNPVAVLAAKQDRSVVLVQGSKTGYLAPVARSLAIQFRSDGKKDTHTHTTQKTSRTGSFASFRSVVRGLAGGEGGSVGELVVLIAA